MICFQTRANRILGTFIVACGFGTAQLAGAHGDLHERIEFLKTEISTNQASPGLWLRLADLQRQHGEFDAALVTLDQAVKLKPGWDAGHLERARIYFDSHEFPQAVSAAADCLKDNAANADALVLRARSLVCMNEPGRAIADYDAALGITNSAPPLPDIYLERARALAGLKRWDEAIRGLDDGMKRLGPTPSLAFPAIEYERQRGDSTGALERLEHAKSFLNRKSYDRLRAEIQNQFKKQ